MECGCCDVPLHVHFRWGVALVGEFNYWALLTPSGVPLSGIGSIREDNAHQRPLLRKKPTSGFDYIFL